jgi:hypothetical protein
MDPTAASTRHGQDKPISTHGQDKPIHSQDKPISTHGQDKPISTHGPGKSISTQDQDKPSILKQDLRQYSEFLAKREKECRKLEEESRMCQSLKDANPEAGARMNFARYIGFNLAADSNTYLFNSTACCSINGPRRETKHMLHPLGLCCLYFPLTLDVCCS